MQTHAKARGHKFYLDSVCTQQSRESGRYIKDTHASVRGKQHSLTRHYGLALGRKQINIVYSLHICARVI